MGEMSNCGTVPYGSLMNSGLAEIDPITLLYDAEMRPTRQRQFLAQLLFGRGHRHVTAEELHREVCAAGIKMALATVYNTLHRFTRARLLREVVVDSGRRHFDTNVSYHHHMFDERTGKLSDIDEGDLQISCLPEVPDGMEIRRVDVVVRVGFANGR